MTLMDIEAFKNADKVGWQAYLKHPIGTSISPEEVWHGAQRIQGGWITTVMKKIPYRPVHVIARILIEDDSNETFVHPDGDATIQETVERFRRKAVAKTRTESNGPK